MAYEPWQYKFLAGIASIAFCQGVYVIFKGLHITRLKRKVEDIPTSKISTGAVGSNVEIKGALIADKNNLVKAPVTGISCAFYKLEIHGLDQQEPIECYSHQKFYLNDHTGGRALIIPEGSKTKFRKSPDYLDVNLDSLDQYSKGIRTHIWPIREELLKKKYKQVQCAEWTFKPEECLYVLGYADSGNKYSSSTHIRLVFKKKTKHPFIISDRHEEDLTQNLNAWASHYTLGGFIEVVLGTSYLYWFFNNIGF